MDYTLITGASGYLGRAFALQCAAAGENLFLTGRNKDRLGQLRDYILTLNPDILIEIYACDLSDGEARKNMFAYADMFKFSRVINVAGADIQKPFEEYTEDKLVFQIRACFEGAVSMCNFAIKHRADRLKILNVSSVSGIYPMPYFAVYSSSKGALTSFSTALNKECKGSGINVTAVLPGAIYTRADVIEYIEKQGVWGRIAAKTPQYVAKKALKASDKGKSKVIIGGANKIMLSLSRLIPEGVKSGIIARKWSKTRKDAF